VAHSVLVAVVVDPVLLLRLAQITLVELLLVAAAEVAP
jgi:hypothetical protein